jgi:hypothetical protein
LRSHEEARRDRAGKEIADHDYGRGIREAMIELEKRALEGLAKASMGFARSSKRFVADNVYKMRVDADYKLTAKQAMFLWRLVWTFRRQFGDNELLGHAATAYKLNVLPDIYLLGDHRAPVGTPEKVSKLPSPRELMTDKAHTSAARENNSSQRKLFEEGSAA